MYKMLITSSDNDKILSNIAKALILEKISPCSNIIQNVKSFYFWDDNFVNENESLLIIKCKASNIEKIKKIIYEKHNYEVPEIISLDFNIISKKYRNWFSKENI